MIALLAGLGMGLSAGVTGTAMVAILLLRRGKLLAATTPDGDEVIEVLSPHEAMRAQQVRNYGDRLAAGDTVLRERLRRFERGGR